MKITMIASQYSNKRPLKIKIMMIAKKRPEQITMIAKKR